MCFSDGNCNVHHVWVRWHLRSMRVCCAADVAQTVHYFLRKGGMDGWLGDTLVLASVVAALVHDVVSCCCCSSVSVFATEVQSVASCFPLQMRLTVNIATTCRLTTFGGLCGAGMQGHVGVNNPFLIATNHRLAIRYNDVSPLENMHVATAFEIMFQQRDCNILSELKPDERLEVRKAIIDMVLATDNAVHTRVMTDLTEYIEDVEAAAALDAAMGSPSHGLGSSPGSQPPRQQQQYSTPPPVGVRRAHERTMSMASATSGASFDESFGKQSPVPPEKLTLVLQVALHSADVSNVRAACCVLRVACCVLRVACCVLRVACCVLRVSRVGVWRFMDCPVRVVHGP